MKRTMLPLICVFAALHAAAFAESDSPDVSSIRWSFEQGIGGWRFISCSGDVCPLPTPSQPGNRALRVDADLSTPAAMVRDVNLDTKRINRVRYRIFIPAGAPYAIKALFYLKDKDGLWFQTLKEEPLEPGKWSEHVVDIGASSVQLQPRGHYRRWNCYLSHKMNQIGIKFFASESYVGPIYVDDIRCYKEEETWEPMRILNFSVNSPSVKRFEKFEVTLEMNRAFRNPFDPAEADLTAFFTAPSGKVMVVPGFYYQDYMTALEETEEKLTPVNQSCWKIRFAPEEVGTHTFEIDIKTARGSDHMRTARRSFVATPSDNPGFVRISRQDHRYFEFDSGRLFYPIGHNFRSPNDERWAVMIRRPVNPDRGTYAYEDVFPKMQANGENFVEIWMCPSWVDIEWSHAWKDYQGLGDYNLANAWKLDRLLGMARSSGIYVHLVLDNHGKISTWCDPEWNTSPYNRANGGFLRAPEEFFTNARAMELYKRKLRYVIARWGWDTTIGGIELWSELDLVGSGQGFMRHPTQTTWHREMTDHLKAIDPWKHLLTTHYSTNYTRIDPAIVVLPNIDYIVVDAYRQDKDSRCISMLMIEAYNYCRQWAKPHMITEYGGTPFGHQNIAALESDLHAGMWSAWMLPMAGTPLLWWFEYIDSPIQPETKGPKYFHFKALRNFSDGEDRRDKDLNVGSITLTGDTAHLGKMCLQSRERAYCWIYDDSVMRLMKDESNSRACTGVMVQLGNLTPGKYDVEFWDTFKGVATGRITVESSGSALVFKLPEFRRDIAVKVKATRNTGASGESANDGPRFR